MSNKRDEFNVTGMTCTVCSAHVEKSVSALVGVKKVNVNLLSGEMSVEYSSEVTADDIISAVVSAGYGASLKGDNITPASPVNNEIKTLKNRIIYSLVFLLPLMYIAMGRMWNFPGTEIFKNPQFYASFILTQLLLTLPVIFINRTFFKKGVLSLIHKSPTMDTLVSVGSGAALIYGIYSLYNVCYVTALGDFSKAFEISSNLYFESAAMILTLITVGKYLESKAKARTTDAVNSLLKLIPDTARVLRGGKELILKNSELLPGDEIIVKTGENIPCDGIILEGGGSVDESTLSGESIPLYKTTGDKITGATLLKSGYIRFKAEAVGTDTVFSKIIQLVQNAASDKAPIARVADKVCKVFVPAVMLISLITFIVWMLYSKNIEVALNYAISVLVISCPCALGLATPTAIMAGTGRGAKMGLLFKNAGVLETLHKVNILVTDKTGTLTRGEAGVTDILPADDITSDALISLAVSIEQKSEHPLSVAILKEAKNAEIYPLSEFTQISGKGLKGVYEGKVILAGNESFMEENGISYIPYDNLKKEGKTVLYFSFDGEYMGAIAISDIVREESERTVNALEKMGIKVIMLTGDNDITARSVAEKTGIKTVISQVAPHNKQEIISNFKNEGNIVAMVGDGVNDAPALTSADIGIAIGGATDVAINSSDVILMHGKFSGCLDAISLSRAVIKNIKQNLFWAFFYNTLGIPLAAGIFVPLWNVGLNPMIGSLAMSLSSLFVVTNALKLRYFKSKKFTQEVNKMTKTLKIKGMMCTHCTGRTQEALNTIDGVSAVVDLTDGGTAFLTLGKDIPDEILIKTVEDAGYTVTSIE